MVTLTCMEATEPGAESNLDSALQYDTAEGLAVYLRLQERKAGMAPRPRRLILGKLSLVPTAISMACCVRSQGMASIVAQASKRNPQRPHDHTSSGVSVNCGLPYCEDAGIAAADHHVRGRHDRLARSGRTRLTRSWHQHRSPWDDERAQYRSFDCMCTWRRQRSYT